LSRLKGNIELRHRLKEIFGPRRVRVGGLASLIYSHSPWARSLLELRRGDLPERADFIVWPETVEEVSRLMRLANEWKAPVIPFGGGSGGCGGTAPVRGGIVCDMKKMNRLLFFNQESLVVSAQAGILGADLEGELSRAGYTLGHFPPSAHSSTLGGYLATRSAGFLSSKYGRIEDMVVNLQAVLPDGSIVKTRAAPRSATGPDFDHLLLGSEGTLAIITRAKLRVWPIASDRGFAAFSFRSLGAGVAALRCLFREGLRPAAVRLTDASGTAMSFRNTAFAKGGNLLCLVFEDHEDRVALEMSMGEEICLREKGRDLGEEPARHWFDHRLSENFQQQSFLPKAGAVMDVIDTAATWSRLVPMEKAVKKALRGRAGVSVSIAHADRHGAGISFHFRARANAGKDLELFASVWKEAMKVVRESGGTIAYRRGIGLARAPWLAEELGPAFGLLEKMKGRLDPNNILNPGKLGLPRNAAKGA